ncbi:MAG: hypothetical protein M3Y28_11105 [Armatimonadota bacterium]|nr:hypothetical protein [Armatimonadota bacterium]
MTALTAAFDAKRKDGKLIAYPLGAAKTIFKGALAVAASATGLTQTATDASGVVFVGVAHETVDNSAGGAAAKSIRVEKAGVFTYAKTGAALTDIGKTALIVDDNTVSTAATTNNVACGVVVGIVDAAHVQVRIDGKVN